MEMDDAITNNCSTEKNSFNLRPSHGRVNRLANDYSDSPQEEEDGNHSYSKYSYYQRQAASVVKDKIDEEIYDKFDAKKLCATSNIIYIADMGCAEGPNTFIAMQNILDAVESKYLSQCDSSRMPEFLVYFNDQPSNDFDALFKSLPKDRKYVAAGVPGSFHNRIFPEAYLHLVHTSCALHWLSRNPDEVLDVNSPAWNKGRVHYSSAPEEVVNAYANQFARDVESFLSARAKELVAGGIMVIIMTGIPHGMPFSVLPTGMLFDALAMVLLEMVREGFISEDQVDSFNVPIYAASPEEMTGLIERNECFRIERMELTDPSSWLEGPIDMAEWVKHMRAAMERIFIEHFEAEIIDEMFKRLIKKLVENSDLLESGYRERTQLFIILKRV